MSTVDECWSPPCSRGQDLSQGNTRGTATGKGKGTGRASGAARGRPVGRGRGTASAGGTAGVSRIRDQYPDPNGQHTGFRAALL